MYEYHLIGNVYKDSYAINDYEEERFLDNPFDKDNANNYMHIRYRYGVRRVPYEYIDSKGFNLENYITEKIEETNSRCAMCYSSTYKYHNEEHYKQVHKLNNNKISIHHIWDRYECFDTILTDVILKDDDTITIDGKDYKVQYKFNKNLNRHDLYIDYTVTIEADEITIRKCDSIVDNINKRVIEYNQSIDELEIILDDRFENYKLPVQCTNSLLDCLKNIWLHKKSQYK